MKRLAAAALVAATACVPTPILIHDEDAGDALPSLEAGAPDVSSVVDSAADATDAALDADAGPVVWQFAVVAGNGTSGFSGDTGQATLAQLGGSYLAGIAKDSAGNLYIADAGNARIRRVDPLGVITTYAGSGMPGYSGDNGSALSAKINGPSGLVVDTAGNVYFSDFNNRAIRKVDGAGVITTYAPLTGEPTGLAIDRDGNLFVAMFALAEILRIDTNKTVTTVAGSGAPGFAGDGEAATAAKLRNPDGVWVDARKNIYIVDNGNFRIRKVDPNGIITTIAGNGTVGDSGDEGPATEAEINSAYGVAADDVGNVYFTDGADNVIRQVDAAGVIHTIAGNKTVTFAGDAGSALGVGIETPGFLWIDKGVLYVSDQSPAVCRLTP